MKIKGNSRNLKEIVNSAMEVNLTNAILKITEIAEDYATLETNSETVYSLGYTSGLDVVVIYEEMVDEDGSEPLMMDYVGYIHGTIKSILSDERAMESIELRIIEHEVRKYDRH